MKRCTVTDKRILALVLTITMLASTWTCGAAFAAENGADGNKTDAKATGAYEILDEDDMADEMEEAEPEPEPEPTDMIEAAEVGAEDGALTEDETAGQPIRLVVAQGTKRTILRSDADGNYNIQSSVSKIRDSKNYTLSITNPAGCKISFTVQDMKSNTDGKFLETTIKETKPSETSEEEQITEISVKVKGTGEAYISYKAEGNETYDLVKGKIIFKQQRSTTILNRSSKVTVKSATPKPIKVKYKKDGKTKKRDFEIKTESGVSESDYGAVQGGGTDGTYSYSAICQLGNETYVKIVKTRLSDMKVVKTSDKLKLNHANDITYDPVNKRLVVTHNKTNKKRVSFVDTSTLKVTGYKDISIPKTLKGATKSQLSDIGGFASVTYMREGKYAGNYIAVISSYHNFLVLDKNFTPVEYISVSHRYDNSLVYYQGVDAVGDRLYIVVYPISYSLENFICVYDMNGEYKGNIKLIKGFEMENLFHSGDKFYGTFYRPVTKVWYTTKIVKKKVKYKKNGKTKYKYKKVKVKEKHTKKVKRSYIYKMGKVTL